MILIAAIDKTLATVWHECLSKQYTLYELDVQDKRSLDLCLKKVDFDALIIDIRLLGPGGVHEIASLCEMQAGLHIIVMTPKPQPREEISAILFGAKAYCAFDIAPDMLLKVVKTVLAKELWVDRKFVSRLLKEIEDITQSRHKEARHLDEKIAALTPRELEIASFVAKGASNGKIAEQLNISERTVKAHLGGIFRKIDISDRLQLALYMNRHYQLSAIWHGGQEGITKENKLASRSSKNQKK